MEKLIKFNAPLSQNSFKEQFKKFSKGFILGTAMIASIMGTSCKQPTDTIDSKPYEIPTPTPTPDPDDPNGGNGGNGEQQQEDKFEQYGGKPYDTTIGNGEYNLHTFMGANTVFDSEEKANFYINEAETYVHGLANQLSESVKDRPAARAYFSEMLSWLENAHCSDSSGFDYLIGNVSRGTAKVMQNIARNLNTYEEKQVFEICYRIFALESHKAGTGRDETPDNYETEKNQLMREVGWMNDDGYDFFKNIDYNKEYGADKFKATANLLNNLLETAASNMNLELTDLQKVINIALTTSSFEALHDRTSAILNHTTADCIHPFGIIENAIRPSNVSIKQQDNGIKLC